MKATVVLGACYLAGAYLVLSSLVFQLHEYKSSSHRIFRLNNIAKALKFLEDSNVSV